MRACRASAPRAPAPGSCHPPESLLLRAAVGGVCRSWVAGEQPGNLRVAPVLPEVRNDGLEDAQVILADDGDGEEQGIAFGNHSIRIPFDAEVVRSPDIPRVAPDEARNLPEAEAVLLPQEGHQGLQHVQLSVAEDSGGNEYLLSNTTIRSIPHDESHNT